MSTDTEVVEDVQEVSGEPVSTIPPRTFAVRLDRTADWDQDFLKSIHVRRQWDCYVYDESRITRCCAFTPSYDLIYAGYTFELEPGFEGRDDVDEEADLQIMGANNQIERDCYVHCHSIDAMSPDDRKEFGGLLEPEKHPECWNTEKDYAEYMENVREQYQGNPCF